MTKESPRLGHVFICSACAERVGLRESFMLIVGACPCEGCGTIVGYEYTVESTPCDNGGFVGVPRWGRLVANCMQAWRHEMWPVALGIAVQDFAGAHAHSWSNVQWQRETADGRKNFRRDACRCGERRERWEGQAA